MVHYGEIHEIYIDTYIFIYLHIYCNNYLQFYHFNTILCDNQIVIHVYLISYQCCLYSIILCDTCLIWQLLLSLTLFLIYEYSMARFSLFNKSSKLLCLLLTFNGPCASRSTETAVNHHLTETSSYQGSLFEILNLYVFGYFTKKPQNSL